MHTLLLLILHSFLHTYFYIHTFTIHILLLLILHSFFTYIFLHTYIFTIHILLLLILHSFFTYIFLLQENIRTFTIHIFTYICLLHTFTIPIIFSIIKGTYLCGLHVKKYEWRNWHTAIKWFWFLCDWLHVAQMAN